MVEIRLAKAELNKLRDDALLIGFFKDKIEISPDIKKLDESANGLISSYMSNKLFDGDKGELKFIYLNRNIKNIALLGLGEEGKYSLETLSYLVADSLKKLRDNGILSVSILLNSLNHSKFDESEIIEKASLSSAVGLYRFTEFKTKEKSGNKNMKQVTLLSKSPESFEKELEYSLAIANAVNKTRDLVNTPPNIATPEYVADYSMNLANKAKLKCTVLDENEIKKLKMECFLGVAAGSANRPRMVILEYYGADRTKKPVAIVGKGITFDSGGINLKPYPSILNMKDDKGGAIAAIHIIEACARLKLRLNLVVIAPLCENMPSGTSYRPDDVLRAHNGMTVEIRNTDAEGRLILADALSYASQLKPEFIIDIATLTGASMIALGYVGTPFLCTDESLAERLKSASKKSLEKIWEFPLWEEYEDNMKSEVADIKHITDEGDAGVIMGAVFLKNFIGSVPWIHIDIGTTVWSKVDRGILTKGATGATVRLLMELLRAESRKQINN